MVRGRGWGSLHSPEGQGVFERWDSLHSPEGAR